MSGEQREPDIQDPQAKMKIETMARQDEVVDYNEWLEVLYKYTGADVADTEESSADYSAITCMGVDRQGVKFVLDAWQNRVCVFREQPDPQARRPAGDRNEAKACAAP